MQSLLLIGNSKTFAWYVCVDALIQCKSADIVESVYEELEYLLNLFV